MTEAAGEILGDILEGIFSLLIESPIALVVVLCGAVIATTCMANCWYNTDFVQRRIKELDPSIVTTQQLERNVFSDSIIQCTNTNGRGFNICIDSNILFSLRYTNCADDSPFPTRPQ
ncbi:MAG: hypothetical protein NTX72_02860 [Candidatus Uhrbacteria bacterium]|nr:hypothetical protein [Candidatus Uhrbacteria bacterium]